jgi:hypothetical protein
MKLKSIELFMLVSLFLGSISITAEVIPMSLWNYANGVWVKVGAPD